MPCASILLINKPPKKRRCENFGWILGFLVTLSESEAQVDCLQIGVTLTPFATEEDYWSNNFETHNKSMHPIFFVFVQVKVNESMLIKIRRQHLTNWYHFCNGRREGVNPSSRVIKLPNLESLNQS